MAAPHFVQANTNGRLHPAHEPSLSPLNRGFLYGDAIYEVWRTYDGVVFGWEEHWRRLERSADALYLPLPFSPHDIFQEIKRTVAAWRDVAGSKGEVYIRLQVTRGAGPIGLDPALADRVDFVILVQSVPVLTPSQLESGLRLSLATTLRRNSPSALNPAWKTGNYLNNLLCLREARARGADEVVITNLDGELTEAAVCNIAFVRDGTVITPPLSAGILAGITRGLLIDHVAPAVGVAIRETTMRPEDLGAMEECFLLSSTKDIQPVSAIDAHTYKTGTDTITRRLKAAFSDYARQYARSRPEQAV